MTTLGWRLIAQAAASHGDFIDEYLGLVVPAASFCLPLDGSIQALPFTNSRLGNHTEAPRDAGTVITSAKMGNNTRFIVHDCIPNCTAELWWSNGIPHIAIRARGPIRVGDVLTLDFRFSDDLTFSKANLRGTDASSTCRCLSCSHGIDSRGALVAYTDGSGKNGRWGVVFVVRPPVFPGAVADKNSGTRVTELFGPVATTPLTPLSHRPHPFFMGALDKTNNTAELTGLGEALLWFKHYSDREAVTIYSDSELAINLVTGKTDPRDNVNLALFVRGLYVELRRHVTLVKVRAHSTHYWNNYADNLCRKEGCCEVGRYGRGVPLRAGLPPIVLSPVPRTAINRVKFSKVGTTGSPAHRPSPPPSATTSTTTLESIALRMARENPKAKTPQPRSGPSSRASSNLS
jgi:ribonuclease HI